MFTMQVSPGAICMVCENDNRVYVASWISHYDVVIKSAMASQITGVSIVCSTVCTGAYLRKYQSSVSLTFVRGIQQWSVVFLHKGPVTRKTHLMTLLYVPFLFLSSSFSSAMIAKFDYTSFEAVQDVMLWYWIDTVCDFDIIKYPQ